MARIAPCPFCGGISKLEEREPDPEMCTGFFGWSYHFVRCTECGAVGPTNQDVSGGPEKAIKQWNTRR